MQRMSPAAPNLKLGHWLVLIYRLPSETSSARSAVWRETRRLGALSLQHGVCLLPLSDQHRAACARLIQRVEGYGGEAVVLDTCSPSDAWQEKTVARFNQARDEEYEEVVDEAERFREEIDRERRKGKYTFAELEDEETNLERLHRYLGQVEARDWFGAPGRAHAVAEVARCGGVLKVFSQEIYERQAGPPECNAAGPGARSVDQLAGRGGRWWACCEGWVASCWQSPAWSPLSWPFSPGCCTASSRSSTGVGRRAGSYSRSTAERQDASRSGLPPAWRSTRRSSGAT